MAEEAAVDEAVPPEPFVLNPAYAAQLMTLRAGERVPLGLDGCYVAPEAEALTMLEIARRVFGPDGVAVVPDEDEDWDLWDL